MRQEIRSVIKVLAIICLLEGVCLNCILLGSNIRCRY